MRRISLPAVLAAAFLGTTTPAGLDAQATADALTAIASWVTVDAATGYEARSVTPVAEALGWEVDRWGNVVARVGSGNPHTVVACALDRPSYAASQITEDGYLRVHRIGRGSQHALWDQTFEANQVRVLTEAGPVAGVVARSNGHFAAQHRGDSAVVGADDLWVDVGATSAEGVAALGIGLLDPVARHWPAWSYASEVAGPDAGARAGCAAIATLFERARTDTPAGTTTFVLSAQHVFGWVGLGSLLARSESVDRVVIVGPGQRTGLDEFLGADQLGRLGAVLQNANVEQVRWIAPAVEAVGAPSERIDATEAATMLIAVAEAVGVTAGSATDWVSAPKRMEFVRQAAISELDPVAALLEEFVETHAVPGHEWAMRKAVLEALPEWAQQRALVDDIGNIVVEAGPDADTTVFIAHIDEVGYEVESIDAAGVVTLGRRGGAVSSAWEGQTAMIHFDADGAPSTLTGAGVGLNRDRAAESLRTTAPEPLSGVFMIRDQASQKDPGVMRAWFGLNAQQLSARGVGVGSPVTMYKEGLRIGSTRFTARALDDRAGSAALVLAAHAIDPDALTTKVVLAWSVHEEGGLRGAAALSMQYASSATRVFSIDTFVSSDTPLESPHFAYAPLGDGPVLRSIENSSVSPVRERRRVQGIARRAGIPLQVGLTQGGTDGTTFTFWGAPNAGLSWPGRYSHSPGEVLDLRDLEHLRDLVVAVATAPAGYSGNP